MSSVALALHEFRFAQKVFWRNPASVFFTALLPVLFLLIFATIFGNDTIDELGGVKVTTYYIPAIVTLAVISATMVNLAMNVTIAREEGLLKRGRGTPLPPWVFIAGRVGNAIVISAIMLVVVTLIGKLLYDAPIPWERLPAVAVTLTCLPSCFFIFISWFNTYVLPLPAGPVNSTLCPSFIMASAKVCFIPLIIQVLTAWRFAVRFVEQFFAFNDVALAGDFRCNVVFVNQVNKHIQVAAIHNDNRVVIVRHQVKLHRVCVINRLVLRYVTDLQFLKLVHDTWLFAHQ